jgi:hypothetical protein
MNYGPLEFLPLISARWNDNSISMTQELCPTRKRLQREFGFENAIPDNH